MMSELSSQDLTDWIAFLEIRGEERARGNRPPSREPTNRDVFGTLKRAFPQLVRKKQ